MTDPASCNALNRCLTVLQRTELFGDQY